MMKGSILTVISIFLMAICCSQPPKSFTKEELAIIHGTDSIMRVLTIESEEDMSVLRSSSSDLSDDALLSDDYTRLCSLMIATVTHPSQDGVGIAGPQVGLNRRIVAVQRFDKEGYPFEVYPNIRIAWASDSLSAGSEGCLSVPDRSEEVLRSQEIIIEYTDIGRGRSESDLELKVGTSSPLPTIRETTNGFTAVIFQHEIDHLDGILYIDRL